MHKNSIAKCEHKSKACKNGEKTVVLFPLCTTIRIVSITITYLPLCWPAEGRDQASGSGIIDVELALFLQVES